jgi:hypothetical protein
MNSITGLLPCQTIVRQEKIPGRKKPENGQKKAQSTFDCAKFHLGRRMEETTPETQSAQPMQSSLLGSNADFARYFCAAHNKKNLTLSKRLANGWTGPD